MLGNRIKEMRKQMKEAKYSLGQLEIEMTYNDLTITIVNAYISRS